ncbi:MAG: YfaZ family protein [Hydrogenimonas sp.]|nr:YfaZ family protein [Hydrogenimonas sp.]
MLKKYLLTAFAAALPLMAQNSAELNLNSDDIEIAGRLETGQNFAYDGRSSRNYLHARYLYSGESRTGNKHLGEVGYLATGTVGTLTRLRFGIGLMASFSDNYVAVPIGLTVKYHVPVAWPVSLNASLYAAPDPLVFADGDGYSAYRIGIESQVIPNASIYGGYRNIDLKYENGREDFNDGWYVGVRFYF